MPDSASSGSRPWTRSRPGSEGEHRNRKGEGSRPYGAAYDHPVRGGCAAFLLLFAAAPARAGLLPIRAYTTADGLAHDGVNRIVEDSRGFVWFCTEGGLSRFDGERFVNLTTKDGLPSDQVRDLLEARDGSYWVATDAGLARLDRDGTSFSRVELGLTGFGASFLSLHEDPSGTLWAGSVGGLYRIDGSRAARVDLVGPKGTQDFIQVN